MTEQSKQDGAVRLNPGLRAHFETIKDTPELLQLKADMAQMRGITPEEAELRIMEIHCQEMV